MKRKKQQLFILLFKLNYCLKLRMPSYSAKGSPTRINVNQQQICCCKNLDLKWQSLPPSRLRNAVFQCLNQNIHNIITCMLMYFNTQDALYTHLIVMN